MALIFGMVSPNMITMTVTTTVDSHAYPLPISFMMMTDPMEDAAMFTRLFPVSIAPRASSKFSSMPKALAARLSPLSFRFSILILLQEEYDISAPEKKADRMTHTIRAAKSAGIIAFRLLCPCRPRPRSRRPVPQVCPLRKRHRCCGRDRRGPPPA